MFHGGPYSTVIRIKHKLHQNLKIMLNNNVEANIFTGQKELKK